MVDNKVFTFEDDMQEENMKYPINVLVVDDEEGARESLELILEDRCRVQTVEDGAKALQKIQQMRFDLVLLDISMPNLNGLEILRRIKAYDQSIDVIMVSALDRAREATLAIKFGARDYITKPFDAQEILNTVERVLQRRGSQLRQQDGTSGCIFTYGDTQIISQSQAMHHVLHLLRKVACASSGVLITGESGTGKELIARAIHSSSERQEKPFVTINCAAIPPELMESELFGHEKGAFTGAYARSVGKFEFANGGTIFLDEVASLRLELQAKLLRVLQEREFTRVGSHQVVKLNVRVIAATNRRLEELVKINKFRSDLFFRLNVVPIELPPLRERQGDIPLLAQHFLHRFNRLLNKHIEGITPAAMAVLEAYRWPGNIRELQNLIERLVVLGDNGEWIDEGALPLDFLIGDQLGTFAIEAPPVAGGLIPARQAFEREYILKVLQRCGWNQTDSARLLKIHRNTLLQKMKALNLRADPAD